MAGIFCCIWRDGNDSEIEFERCKPMLKRQGRDKWNESKQLQLLEWKARFVVSQSTVYHTSLQFEQLYTDTEGNIFLWTGDIVPGCLRNPSTKNYAIFEDLNNTKDVCLTLTRFKGPYSIVYYQKYEHKLYFACDCMGRHRLLVNLSASRDRLVLSSTLSLLSNGPVEIPAIGIFVFDLTTSMLSVYPWQQRDAHFERIVGDLKTGLGIDLEISDPILRERKELSNPQREPESHEVAVYEEIVESAMKNMNPEPLKINTDNPHLESEKKTLETLKSGKGNLEFPDSKKKTAAVSSSVKKEPDIVHPNNFESIMNSLMERSEIRGRVHNVLWLLKESIKTTLSALITQCDKCRDSRYKPDCHHIPLGILFSGGVDSTILAMLVDQFYPEEQPIELFNVAFEIKKPSVKNTMESVNYNVPDRLAAHKAWLELQKRRPERCWNLVECNVFDTELRKFVSTTLSELVDLRSTIRNDAAAACALWFASRGIGVLYPEYPSGYIYHPDCRTILVGTGADELFGGYPRHRLILNRGGWPALYDELDAELKNVEQKTVTMVSGVVSDHGRPPIFPYLDRKLVEYVSSLKPWERCYPTDMMPDGLGDKLLLRLVARELRLRKTANVPHVPIEIGSGIPPLWEDENEDENTDA